MRKITKKLFVYFLSLSLVLPNFSIPAYASEITGNDEIQVLEQEVENDDEVEFETVSGNEGEEEQLPMEDNEQLSKIEAEKVEVITDVFETETEINEIEEEEENVVCKHEHCNNPAESASDICDSCKEAFFNEDFYEYVNEDEHNFSVTCTCGDVFSDAEPHWEYQNGLCLCGYDLDFSTDDVSTYLTYEILDDGTICITRCDSDIDIVSLDIPTKIKGRNVTRIGDYAFNSCQNLTNITLPENLISIGTGAFSGCENLSSITLPENLINIGEGAFSSCNFTSITIPQSVTRIENSVFSDCYSLNNIQLPDGITNIGAEAFYNCYSLNSITIPESVTSIGDNAFNTFSPNFTIYGTLKSYAQTYANTWEIPFVNISLFVPYTIIFDKNNASAKGSMKNQVLVSNSGTKLNLNVYDCSGYYFTGWNTKADGSGISLADQADGSTLSTKKDDVITLYAQWEKINYIIIYNLNGGVNNKSNPESYDVATETIILKNPTLTGHTFAGWYIDSEFGKKITSIPKGSAIHLTLFAKWIPNKYNIVFKGNGNTSGSMSILSNCKYGKTYTLKANTFKRTGYTFIGWNTKADGTGTNYKNQADIKNLVSSDGETITLYAQWKKVSYTITYNLNGGKNNSKNPATYSVTTSDIKFQNPTRTGYTFGGWYSDSKFTKKVTAILKGSTGNKAVYAKWTANKYSIAFNGNGSTSGNMANIKNCKYGSSYSLTSNAFKKTGYSFAGWNKKADGTGTAYKDKASVKNLTSSNGKTVTLYAQWKKVNYTITYNLNGGKNNSKNPATYSVTTSDIKLQNPTRTGYTFGGWYSDSKFTKKVTTIPKGSTGNKAVYAKWIANKYSIAFKGNGSNSGSMATLSNCKYGSSYSLKTNAFKRTGYTFTGWNTKADGSGTTYKNKASVKNLTSSNGKTVTLYAQWKLTNYSIRYNLNGGKNNSKNPASYTVATADIKLQNPARTGYTFGGWYSDSKYTKKVTTIKKGSTGNKTLYAKWNVTKYAIKYNINGGKNNSKNPASYTVATADIKLQNPSRTGYTFGGWYSDSKLTKKVTTIAQGSTGNKTLYAKWTVNKYNIAFNGNKNTSGSMKTLSNCKYGSSYTLTANAFKKTGYTFTGWNTKADGSGTEYKDKASIKNLTSANGKTITLHAQWKKVTYTITYNLNGGKNNSKNPTSYTITTSDIKLQNPSRTGYTFKGWYSDSKCTKQVKTISKGSTGNKTLYAKWSVNTYNIAFNGNGNTDGSMKTISNCSYGKNYTLTDNAFKKTGYTFIGWNTQSDGSGTTYKNKASIKNLTETNQKTITLYAMWEVERPSLGIDVSTWNGNIDWNKVKNSGVSFVIIRTGFRGSTQGALYEDNKFRQNIQGATNVGLKVGVYFFSQAINEAEAVEEASMVLGQVKGYKLTYPVFIDVESSGGRGDEISSSERTRVINAFCQTIQNGGLRAGIYANKTWLSQKMNVSALNKYKIWLAQYNDTVTYSGKYDMWQYSSKGSIPGISGNVDMNFSYFN